MTLHCRIFGHSKDWHRGRDTTGQVVKVCDTCLQPLGVLLAGEVIREPLPQSVAGAVTTKARPLNPRRASVTPMQRRP